MGNYRVYYVERAVDGMDARDVMSNIYGGTGGGGVIDPNRVTETEWEEEYEGRNAEEALAAFFRDHAGEDPDVRMLEEDGTASFVGSLAEYNPDRTYIWVEDGKLMEYQGIDEATPGMVACPLCDGTGEVDEAVAQEFAEKYGQGDGA
jgi:hypothetical protein